MLEDWFVEQIKALLTNEGSPTLRIIANIVGSFLIWACYLLFSGLTQKLKEKYPNASGGLEAKIVEKMLVWSTIILMAILLGTSILSAIELLIKAFPKIANGTDLHPMSLKQAVENNLNHFKQVAQFVFGSLLLIVTLTAVEVVLIRLHRGLVLGDAVDDDISDTFSFTDSEGTEHDVPF
ncbi:hypothetical protein HYR99_10955 [Candidatus Poribacteria bacterium]|nr:hypothetical protein [Candidatus Poribacteria bacterium]